MKPIEYQVIMKSLMDLLQIRRKALADLEAENQQVSQQFYKEYARKTRWALAGGSLAEALPEIFMAVKNGCKQLNGIGIKALKQKNLLAQIAQLTPTSPNKSVIFEQMVKAESANMAIQEGAKKWAKQKYREVGYNIVKTTCARPAVGSAHNLSIGKGLQAEYEKAVDEFAIALEKVIEDTSMESCFQMAGTILDTLDPGKYTGALVERSFETRIAQMDRKRDAYIKSYMARKNNLTKAVREAEVALESIKKLGTSIL